jgi:hypothetical protein
VQALATLPKVGPGIGLGALGGSYASKVRAIELAFNRKEDATPELLRDRA